MMNHIYNEHHNLMENMDQSWFSREDLQLYANAKHSKGAYLSNCWGQFDGTVRPVSRPRKNQRTVYNGHKRVDRGVAKGGKGGRSPPPIIRQSIFENAQIWIKH